MELFREIPDLAFNFEIKPEEWLLLANEARTEILLLTERGLDYEGRPFADYSNRRPYYHYPNGRVGASAAIVNARRRLARVGLQSQFIDDLTERRQKSASRFFLKTGKVGKRTPLGIKYEGGYRQFKFEGLGRTTVDLTGPSAPHMLQELQVVLKPDGVALGIYGEAAGRAEAHNEGDPSRGIPQRRFLDVTEATLNPIVDRLVDRVLARWI